MTPEQEQVLREKLSQLGYGTFEVFPGDEQILMLHVQGHFVCSVDYALSMPDAQLKSLVDETVAYGN